MEKKDFKKQYLTKKWYELSKRIKARDKNTCQMCGRHDKPVSVHHLVYHEERKVWEYNDDELICICDDCHKLLTDASAEMYEDYKRVKQQFREFGFSDFVFSGVICQLECLLSSVALDGEIPSENDPTLQFLTNVVCASRDFNDLKVLERLGVDMSEYMRNLYPQLYKEYISKKPKQ